MKHSSTTTDQHSVTEMTTRTSYLTDYTNDSDELETIFVICQRRHPIYHEMDLNTATTDSVETTEATVSGQPQHTNVEITAPTTTLESANNDDTT